MWFCYLVCSILKAPMIATDWTEWTLQFEADLCVCLSGRIRMG